MSKTLFDLTYELARALGVLSEGIATGGDTDTILDSVERLEANDFWNGGTAWITYDAGGLGAAPQGEYGFVSDFALSGGNISLRTALTASVGAGDRYAIAGQRYPLQLLIQKINETFGVIEKTDLTTVVIAGDQLLYSLPADVLELKQVWVQPTTDSDRWEPIYDWSVQKSATGSVNKLIFERQFMAGLAVKLVYVGYHQVLRIATDKLDDSLHSKQIVYNAAVKCLLWYKSKVGDSDTSVNDLLNIYQPMAQAANTEHAQRLPKKSAKTIHLVLNRP